MMLRPDLDSGPEPRTGPDCGLRSPTGAGSSARSWVQLPGGAEQVSMLRPR